jgi:hypothetical protein
MLGATMIRLGTAVLIVASGLCTAALAQDTGLKGALGPPVEEGSPAPLYPIPVKIKTTPTPAPATQPGHNATQPAQTAPVSSTTRGFLNSFPDPFPYSLPSYRSYPQGGGGGGGGGGTRQQNFPSAELTFPTDPKDARSNPPSKPGSSSSSATTTGNGAAARPSKTPPAQLSVDREDSPGLPAATEKAAPVKKPYTEGHVILFLRSPGDEDPSPKGVLARFSREAKIVKRLAPDVAKGDKPVTKPEDSVLRDPAPQGFYLPDEIDAWVVTPEGAIVLLESENALFDRIAALALSARLNVVGTETQVFFDPAVGAVTKVKVAGLTLDGSEPKAEPSAPGSSVGTGQERG